MRSTLRKLLAMGVLGGGAAVTSFADDFSRADGPIGNGWIGDTWTIANGAAVNTPGLSSEKLTDPGLEAWSSATNLTSYTETIAGTSAINQETTEIHGGSNAAKFIIDGTNGNAQFTQAPASLAQYDWLLASAYAWCASGSKQIKINIGTAPVSVDKTLATAYGLIVRSWWLPTTNKNIGLIRGGAATGLTIYADDLSCKQITKSTLFAARLAWKDYRLKANLTTIHGINVGVVGNLDNPSNPVNYIAAMCDGAGTTGTGGSNTYAIKAVGGVITSLLAGGGTYTAGQVTELVKFGTVVHVYSNYIRRGTYSVTDAEIVDNLYCGIMSTYSDPGCKIDDYSADQVTAMAYVLEVGDSKTVGNNGGAGPSADGDMSDFRNGHTIFIEGPAKVATNGWKMADAKAAIDAAIAAATVTPIYCFLNIGYNDASVAPTTEASWKADCQYIIDAINTAYSSCEIYLDKGWSTDRAVNMAIINTWIDTLVAANTAKNVYAGLDETVWMEGGDAGATYTADGVHPNAAGYTYRAALRKQLVGLPV